MSSLRYEVILSPKAEKQLDALPKPIQRRIAEAAEGLETNPRPHGVKKLEGADNLWRIRVGDYRLVYTIEDDRLIVLVVKIGHRREIYRG